MKARKNNSRKLTVVLLSVILVLCCTIGGTLAWLTATSGTVTNTFTVGDINISISETDATVDGNNLKKDYKIIPGATATKDPAITVAKGSENCYVYALVDNQVVLNNTVVATPNIGSEWIKVGSNGTKTLYRYNQIVTTPTAETGTKLTVFTEVKYADSITKADISDLNGKTIVISGYAHQSDNITDVSVADAAANTWADTTATTN